MQIVKLQRKINRFLKTIDRDRNQSPSINAMTMVLLIYKQEAVTNEEIAKAMGKSVTSIKKLGYSLRDGTARHRTGFGFVECFQTDWHGRPKVYYLTPRGKKFAKIIYPVFEK